MPKETKKTRKAEWELYPERYEKTSEGEFVLKQDGTPRLKRGRKTGGPKRPYNFSKATLAKQKAKRKERAAKRKEAKAQWDLRKARHEKKVAKKGLKNLEGSAKSTILTDQEVEEQVPTVKKALKEKILFKPNPGPQTEFLAAPEFDVLFGGAAGGSKSYGMLVDLLRFAHRSAHRALLLRRSTGELTELIDKSRDLYPKAFPGAKFRESEKTWVFPSGAKAKFGYLEKDADVYRYVGQSYTWIGVDEITQMPTEFFWNILSSRLRTSDPEITCYMRCTANPGGVGSHWVKKRYIDPAPANTSFVGEDGMTRKFIPAKLSDNPHLYDDGKYEKVLKSLPPVLRKQLLEGDWDVSEGAAFTEFDHSVHVIPPFKIPVGWERLKGIDYGYASESAVIWGAIDPSDGTIVIYRELYKKGLTGLDLGNMMTAMELTDPKSIQGILDWACYAQTGHTGPTIAQEIMRTGHKVRRADKNRKAGKIQIHEYLKTQHTGRPRLQIFNTCPNLIRELQSIPLKSDDAEDVDTNAPDHAYDALRYLLMSRPKIIGPQDLIRQYHETTLYQPADTTFGY